MTQTVATKPEEFISGASDGLQELCADFQILADAQRLRILCLLTTGERCVCEITQALGISQPLASYHLGLLREAGLVRDRRDAHWIYYSLNTQRLQEIGTRYGGLFDPQHIPAAAQDGEERCP